MLYLKLYIFQDQKLGISTNILLHNNIENVYYIPIRLEM